MTIDTIITHNVQLRRTTGAFLSVRYMCFFSSLLLRAVRVIYENAP